MQWWQHNNPFNGETFKSLDQHTRAVFMRAHTQFQNLREAFLVLQHHVKPLSDHEAHVDNMFVIKFD